MNPKMEPNVNEAKRAWVYKMRVYERLSQELRLRVQELRGKKIQSRDKVQFESLVAYGETRRMKPKLFLKWDRFLLQPGLDSKLGRVRLVTIWFIPTQFFCIPLPISSLKATCWSDHSNTLKSIEFNYVE